MATRSDVPRSSEEGRSGRDLATDWWRLHLVEAAAARPKIIRISRMPGPVAIELEGRRGRNEEAGPRERKAGELA